MDPSDHELVVAETIALTNGDASSFNQSITPDVQSDFAFFVSHAEGVFYISLESWIRLLEKELAEPQNEGLEFRLNVVLDSATSRAELCIPRSTKRGNVEDSPTEVVNSCVVMADGNLGYFVLTTMENEPQAVFLDAPENQLPEEVTEYMRVAIEPMESRPTYQPPKEFWNQLQFHAERDRLVPARHRASLTEEIRLSPANLDILMNAHRTLSHDTHQLQTAVSDLFIRCERLRDEFRDQVVRVAKLMGDMDSATSNEKGLAGGDGSAWGHQRIDERLDRVKARQEAINARYERIRRKMANIGSTDLSEKEAAFVEELQTMDRSLEKSAQTLTDDPDGSEEPAWQRFQQVKELQKDLSKRVEKASQRVEEQRATIAVKVPSHSRKQETEQIEAMLQREDALVEAAATRLRNLGISIPMEGGS